MRKKRPKHGGRRPGAGRPKKSSEPKFFLRALISKIAEIELKNLCKLTGKPQREIVEEAIKALHQATPRASAPTPTATPRPTVN